MRIVILQDVVIEKAGPGPEEVLSRGAIFKVHHKFTRDEVKGRPGAETVYEIKPEIGKVFFVTAEVCQELRSHVLIYYPEKGGPGIVTRWDNMTELSQGIIAGKYLGPSEPVNNVDKKI